MKNKLYIISILTSVFFISCTKEKSLTFGEYIEREKNIIQSFITKNEIEVLYEYPYNRVFEEKQYVQLENGCYLHVVDSGNGKRAISGLTSVLMQTKAINMLTEEYLFSGNEKQIKFTFGKAKEVMEQWSNVRDSPEFILLSEGLESALNFVGENAKVRMIIPFIDPNSYNNQINQIQIIYPKYSGSQFQKWNYLPFYYDEIYFHFTDN